MGQKGQSLNLLRTLLGDILGISLGVFGMKIHVINDPWGEWCELWVDGVLRQSGHSLRPEWLLDLMTQTGIEVVEEEKCLDPCHGDCECEDKDEDEAAT